MLIADHLPFALAALGAAVVCGAIAVYAWQRRADPGILLFALLMAALAWMSFTSTFEYLISAHHLGLKVLANQLYLIGGASTPLLAFLFVLRYTQHDRWLTRPIEILLWVPVVLEILLVFTNDRFGLFWTAIGTTSLEPGAEVIFTHSPAARLLMLNTYALMLAAIGVLAYTAMRAPAIYRRQSLLLLAAMVIPALVNVVYFYNLGPWQNFDLTPVAYAISGLLLAFAIFRYQLVDLTPVALDTLFANLGDGVLVVNGRGLVVSANPAARLMLALPEDRLLGKQVSALPQPWSKAMVGATSRASPAQEVTLHTPGSSRAVEVTASPMYGRDHHAIGHILVLHDVTTHRLLQGRLAGLNLELEERVAHRTVELSTTVTQLETEVAERERAEAAMRAMRDMLAEHVANLSSNLSILYEVILLGGQALNVTAVRAKALELITTTFKAQAGFVLLWDTGAAQAKLAVAEGLTQTEISGLEAAPPDWLFQEPVPHTILNLPASDAPVALRLPGMAACLTGAVQRHGLPVASVGIFWQQTPALSVEAIALFSALVDQLAILAENARLQQVEKETVVLEERKRLARDLHDSVTQALYALALNADTVAHSVRNGRMEHVDQQLNRITGAARQALREMRLLLYELRLATPATMHLGDALQLRLDAVERRAGMAAELHVEPGLVLPPAVEQELYWVAMEALNNALKHAAAEAVVVSLAHSDGAVEMVIADDGVGMTTEGAAGGLGLLSMRERAARAGGELSVDRSPSGGVAVRVRLAEATERTAAERSTQEPVVQGSATPPVPAVSEEQR